VSDAIFLPDGPNRFSPTELARGPWDPDALHGGAPAALLARAVELLPGDGAQTMAVVRLTYELLRPVPLAPLDLTTRVVRPGKRVQLVEASLHAGGEEVARVLALRIRRDDDVSDPAAAEDPPPRGPHDGELLEMPAGRPLSFARDAMELRFTAGSFWEVGPAFAWFRLRVALVAGEQPTPLQRLAAAGDFGNGIATAVSWRTHVFINPDLTLYLERPPEGEWIGLDAVTRIATAGVGVSDSVLYDERGRVGRAQQGLFVARR
jgi:hypothetical protein